MADEAAAQLADTKLETSVKTAIETAQTEALTKDPTLQDDYDLRDQLTAARRANAVALSECNARIAAKEGPEVRKAKAIEQFLARPFLPGRRF